jgi:hypothetical protein
MTDAQYTHLCQEISALRQEVKEVTDKINALPTDNMSTGLFIFSALSQPFKTLTPKDIEALRLLKDSF